MAGKHGKERCVIAVERDGTPRVPSEAAMMEYVLAMATSDVESRPKGGWKEYEMGDHVKPGLHGRKQGELLGGQKRSSGRARTPTRPSAFAASRSRRARRG